MKEKVRVILSPSSLCSLSLSWFTTLEKLSYIEKSLVLLAVLAIKGIRNHITLPEYMDIYIYIYTCKYIYICICVWV
jgi:hypothetical protein